MIHDHIETIAANSFRNFHAKGLDYLCIQRSAQITVKAYFYDRPDNAGPDVVCPHDHRYPFSTTILAGESRHRRYSEVTFGQRFQRFHWMTPLNGGAGFTHDDEAFLSLKQAEQYRAGQTYWCEADEIHTIRITQPGTILLLQQFADVIPISTPTSTYVPGDSREPPSLDGLYDRMDEDYARKLLGYVEELL